MSWLSAFYLKWRNRDDAALANYAFASRPVFTGYDPAKLEQGATRAAITEDARRFLAATRSQPHRPKPRRRKPVLKNVVAMRKAQ